MGNGLDGAAGWPAFSMISTVLSQWKCNRQGCHVVPLHPTSSPKNVVCRNMQPSRTSSLPRMILIHQLPQPFFLEPNSTKQHTLAEQQGAKTQHMLHSARTNSN